MTDVDLGWQDVLRRAERRPRISPRILVVGVAVAAVVTAAPALGVLLTRPGPPQLPADKITGSISVILEPRSGATLVKWARWKGHDGICYLVPRVHTGCLLRGERSRALIALPVFTRFRRANAKSEPRLIIMRPRSFHVVALADGKAKIVRKR